MYTMCPPGCYHNGFVATPELGHRMYGYTLLDCIVEYITHSEIQWNLDLTKCQGTREIGSCVISRVRYFEILFHAF